jgi:poly(A) polymerase
MADDRLKSLMGGAPNLVQALSTLEADGHQAHLVGGSVRDALMGRPVSDYDISTSAHPDVVGKAFEAKGNAVHPTGIDHGTQTIVIADEPFEITTWRRDVATDGRRAVIAFADTMAEDAQRRDFTVNALYADQRGEVFDPTGQGIDDAENRRIRFIGNPEDRIREDSLRVLRYFRFCATHADGPVPGPDLDAATRLAPLTRNLPGERVGAETLKLLTAPNPGPSLAAMHGAGLLKPALGESTTTTDQITGRIDHLRRAEGDLGLAADPIRRLSVLADDVPKEVLKLSKSQAMRMTRILAGAQTDAGMAEIGYRHGKDIGLEAALVRAARNNSASLEAKDVAEITRGSQQRLPVQAADLMPQYSGKALGDHMRHLEDTWVKSGFKSEKEDLLSAQTPRTRARATNQHER